MSTDLVLQPSCGRCGSFSDLYGSSCKHLTLCLTCGKAMAENRVKCQCGTLITRLIREYNVRACPSSEKNYFIGRFSSGIPNFKKKKNENKWSLQKECLQGRQVTDALREKFKNRPWLLEDEAGQFQFQGVLEGSQSATYYILMLQGKEFVAIPAGSWYNFNKVAQYKQLTLEEAEEKMKNRRKTADGYERWMMKAANNGAAAFGEVERDEKEPAAGGGKGRKNSTGDEEEGNASDRGEEDEGEEAGRRNRLGLNKKGGNDDEEGRRGGDFDLDDDVEKGDDWEHEEIFTDDDELLTVDPEEREDLAPEIPAPPEIKQDEEDEDEGDEDEGVKLSKSGKELKKLLGKANGCLDDSDTDEDDDDDDDDDDLEDDSSPVLAPRKVTPKEETAENPSPAKPGTSGAGRGTPPTSKSSKGKRKNNGEETKTTNGASLKKVKAEPDIKSVKDESVSASRSSTPSKGSTPSSSLRTASIPPSGPVSEEELRAAFLQKTQMTTQSLVLMFKSRLKTKEDKVAFTDILRRISKIHKTNGGSYVVLREQ